MRIEVEKIINETLKEVYYFNQFDFNIVFVEYLKFQKVKRTWTKIECWDNYDKRNCTIEQPILSEEIKNLAYQETVKYIKVQTFAEWKNKK